MKQVQPWWYENPSEYGTPVQVHDVNSGIRFVDSVFAKKWLAQVFWTECGVNLLIWREYDLSSLQLCRGTLMAHMQRTLYWSDAKPEALGK